MKTDKRWVFPVLLLALIIMGCGDGRPTTIPVTGRVTFAGNAPPAAGRLYLTAQEAVDGFPLRPGSAQFDEQGYFEVTTWKPGDGIMPGSYHIAVECWEVEPTVEGPPAKSHLPSRYQSPATSGLTLDVAITDGAQELQIDIVP